MLFAETVESESRQQSAAQADRFCTHRPGFVPILQLPHGPPCMPAFGHFSVQSGRTNLDGPGLPRKSSVSVQKEVAPRKARVQVPHRMWKSKMEISSW